MLEMVEELRQPKTCGKMVLCGLLAFFSLFPIGQAELQAQRHVFSEVKLNRQSAYPGQPIEVSVGIYTSTWFTKGLNFGNIKVQGAFTVYFRSVSTNKTVNGKTYAGVEAIYNVFPYAEKDLSFPSLEFTVETPKEGDYKGVPVKVKTQERRIQIKAIPPGFDRSTWLVANGLNLSESWQGDQQQIKVGEVLQRTVRRTVYGTVSELIPPIAWDSIEGVSLYPTRSEVRNEKTKTSIYAVRSEGIRYLFEKEGQVTLPAIELTWWNPSQQKLYKKTLKAKTIKVLPNPELGMLETVKDSLAVAQNTMEPTEEEAEQAGLFGLTYRQILLLLLGLALAIGALIRLRPVFKRLSDERRQKREAFKQTEAYFFSRFTSSLDKADNKANLQALYAWIDRLDLEEPTLAFLSLRFGNEGLKTYVETTSSVNNLKGQKSNFVETRKNYLQRDQKVQADQLFSPDSLSKPWINP